MNVQRLAPFFDELRKGLAAAADRISRGDLNVPELPATGKDEVSELTASFNRMYVSLVKALRMLDH